jgi:hypothetical protein
LHNQKIHKLIHAVVAIQTAETLSIGPASNLAEEFAAYKHIVNYSLAEHCLVGTISM